MSMLMDLEVSRKLRMVKMLSQHETTQNCNGRGTDEENSDDSRKTDFG